VEPCTALERNWRHSLAQVHSDAGAKPAHPAFDVP
jgi:hypothetical protein